MSITGKGTHSGLYTNKLAVLVIQKHSNTLKITFLGHLVVIVI